MSILATRLKELRENKGWSKTEVARRLGMKASSTYSNWEYGNREPDLEMVTKIARLYQVSTDYLLGNKEIKIKNIDRRNEDSLAAHFSNRNDGKELSKEKIEEIKSILDSLIDEHDKNNNS